MLTVLTCCNCRTFTKNQTLAAMLRPGGYTTFFMLNSTEHEISTAHKKLQYRKIKTFLALSLSDAVFIMLMLKRQQLLAF